MRSLRRPTGPARFFWQLGSGRHRRPDPPVRVTLVLASGSEVAVAPESAAAKAMGQVAHLLAHW